MTNRRIALTALGLLVTGGLALVQPDLDTAPRAPATATVTGAPSTDRAFPLVFEPRASDTAAEPVPAPPARESSLAALLGAPGHALRASVESALKQRSRGGRLYARVLTRGCGALAALEPPVAPPDLNDPRHQRALVRQTELSTGCGQLPNDEWLALANVAAGEPADDPVLAVLERAGFVVQPADRRTLVAVLSAPDPLLLDELGTRLLWRENGDGQDYYFDGQRFADDTSRAVLQAALRLLPCDFGLVCDERDPSVWMDCLRGEGCYDSRAQQVQAEAGGDVMRQTLIENLRRRLGEAIRTRAVERFVPTTPSP